MIKKGDIITINYDLLRKQNSPSGLRLWYAVFEKKNYLVTKVHDKEVSISVFGCIYTIPKVFTRKVSNSGTFIYFL